MGTRKTFHYQSACKLGLLSTWQLPTQMAAIALAAFKLARTLVWVGLSVPLMVTTCVRRHVQRHPWIAVGRLEDDLQQGGQPSGRASKLPGQGLKKAWLLRVDCGTHPGLGPLRGGCLQCDGTNIFWNLGIHQEPCLWFAQLRSKSKLVSLVAARAAPASPVRQLALPSKWSLKPSL